MFNKPKRNFRSRKRDSESDEEVTDVAQVKDVTKSTAGGQSQTKTAVDKEKKSNELKPVSSANSLLSFVSNEEGILRLWVRMQYF